jgi:putative peptidoglycan lipid II flippase
MFKNVLKVGGWTLASRITGFARDILMAAIVGAGPLMDAFAVAFRLPNHFRAIFGEGAFANAFVPAYTRVRTQGGVAASDLFHGRILTLLLGSQLLLLALALVWTSGLVDLLAPGFAGKDSVFQQTVELTRITFPYLLCMTLVTLWADALAAVKQFAAAAAAPILLNLTMIATLLLAVLFKTPAHAAAWGVLIAGVLELSLLFVAARRAGVLVAPQRPVLDPDVRAFFRAFGPAVIGSAGVQIALLADTVIVSFLPTGGASSLYYADRLYQLPIGVIGIAAGTVLLPEMSGLIARGEPDAAHRAQNRAIGFTLLLAAPFVAGFLAIPDLIVAALFERGHFNASAGSAAAAVLAAYTLGLPAVVLIRSAVASFTARGDTRTPLWASLTAIACNLALKLVLWKPLGAVGLALGTALGAWINVAILMVLAVRHRKAAPDAVLGRTALLATAAAIVLALALWGLRGPMTDLGGLMVPRFAREVALALLAVTGAAIYGGVVLLAARAFGVPLRRR